MTDKPDRESGQGLVFLAGIYMLYLATDALVRSCLSGILMFPYHRGAATGPIAAIMIVFLSIAGLYLTISSLRRRQ